MKLQKRVFNFIKKNKLLMVFLISYVLLMLSIIKWGIPNPNHPFNYYMDEWHQMQSIRSLATYGSPNVAGAANGTLFHFLVSGIYLLPFIALKIIDPFIIKSNLTELVMQEKLFIVLRINTILFGILSALALFHVAKKYLKINPLLPVFFLIFNPLWMYQSHYFKYDIALAFWIVLAFIFIFAFAKKQTLKNYLLAGVFCALTLATKVSALVMLPIYIYAFFHFVPRKKRNYTFPLFGFLTFISVFIVFGISDLLLKKGDITEYLYSNLVHSPKVYDNFLLDLQPWWVYLLAKVWPLDVGYVFFILSVLAIVSLSVICIKKYSQKKMEAYKHISFILISFLLFSASMLSLGLGASGNRLVVLLPFLALLVGYGVTMFWKRFSKKWRMGWIILGGILALIQVGQSLVMVYVKLIPDPRETSSKWILQNVKPGSTFGIENIPIYQQLPDVVLKEYYESQESPSKKLTYKYTVINATTKKLPEYVVISNREFERNYLKDSPKKSLILRLEKEKYTVVADFKQPQILYRLIGNELSFYTSAIVGDPNVAIYQKKK